MNIVFDMDCTIALFQKKIVEIYNNEYSDNVIDYNSSYWFSQCTKANFQYFRDVCNRKGIFKDLEPIEGMIDLINELSERHKIIFVTNPVSNHYWKKIEKVKWLTKYFPNLEYDLCFTGDKYLIDCDIFIDDDIKYLNNQKQSGIRICYGDYGWNKDWKGLRVENAIELEMIINIIENEQKNKRAI